MKTRTGNISAESLTIGDGGIWIDGERIDKIRQPKSYRWEPKEDITAHELALCMPILITAMRGFPVENAISQLPDNCKRHFTEE